MRYNIQTNEKHPMNMNDSTIRKECESRLQESWEKEVDGTESVWPDKEHTVNLNKHWLTEVHPDSSISYTPCPQNNKPKFFFLLQL